MRSPIRVRTHRTRGQARLPLLAPASEMEWQDPEAVDLGGVLARHAIRQAALTQASAASRSGGQGLPVLMIQSASLPRQPGVQSAPAAR